jgi:hypothetical protein
VAAGKENSLKQIKVFASFFKKKCLLFVVLLKARTTKTVFTVPGGRPTAGGAAARNG